MGSGQLESRTHNQPFYTMYLKRIKKKMFSGNSCLWHKECDAVHHTCYNGLFSEAFHQKIKNMWAFDTGATFLSHPHVNCPRSWLERECFQKYGIPRDLYHISLRLGVYTTKMPSLSDLKSEVQCQGICFLWKLQRMTFPVSPSL